MRRTLRRLLPALLLPFLASTDTFDPGPVEYPETRQVDQVDDYFGVEVADPYRWLEDLDGEETAAWVAAQNAVAEPFLAALPGRSAIEDRLREIWNYERWSTPSKRGERYFYNHNDGLQDQSVVYVAEQVDEEGDEPPGRVLLDPNGWSDDATVALAGFTPSRDGRFVAYAQSDGGSDWRKWKVHDVETGEDTGDLIDFTKFTSISWMPDNSGFFYSRYPPREDDPAQADGSKAVSVYFHALGTDQSEDRLVFSQPEHPRRNPYASVSEDAAYLLVNLQEGYLENAVHYRKIDEPDSAIRPLLDQWDALYGYIVNIGPVFLFETNKEAPRNRIVAVDVDEQGTPGNPTLHEVLPESEDTLSYVSAVGGKLVLNYLHDARTVVRLAEPNGTQPATPAGEVELPGIGTAGGFGGRFEDSETYYSYSSFGTPSQIHRYDVATGESQLIRSPAIDADLDGYETEQVFYESADGTRIPMFITHRAGLERNGDNPTLLYGYGGFNIFADARILLVAPCLARNGRHAGDPEPARRRRVRPRMAPGGHEGEQAERLRRLHRRRRMADRRGLHEFRTHRDSGRQQRRPAGRRDPESAAPTCSGRHCRRSASSTCCATTCRAPTPATGRPTTACRRTKRTSGPSTPTRRCTPCRRAAATRRRWSPPPITTTEWCPGTASSTQPRCNGRRAATTRC